MIVKTLRQLTVVPVLALVTSLGGIGISHGEVSPGAPEYVEIEVLKKQMGVGWMNSLPQETVLSIYDTYYRDLRTMVSDALRILNQELGKGNVTSDEYGKILPPILNALTPMGHDGGILFLDFGWRHFSIQEDLQEAAVAASNSGNRRILSPLVTSLYQFATMENMIDAGFIPGGYQIEGKLFHDFSIFR